MVEDGLRKKTVTYWVEILSAGPPKDGIPALDGPDFRPATSATDIEGRVPVITVALEGQVARAYPIRYLMWHEIVNDTIGSTRRSSYVLSAVQFRHHI